ncbi:MAG TPA: FG-GAP-like repeat-containing protein [Terriglobales bacterium]|nr:FG-GAP-like repeat-containing protein [Terriglobales bacterium]
MTRRIAIFLAGILATYAVLSAAPPQRPADASAQAAHLNNLGAAYMNQQLFEKALKTFQDAAALDPKLQIARQNQGIALLNLGKVDAARPLLEEAVKQNPNDPHAWYNLGLLFKNSGDAKAAIDAFRHVTGIDPNDADSWYFLGASYAENKQYAEAMDAFQHALKLNPQHASAEFGFSRAYQQSGDLTHAREHLVRFQYITQNKLGVPISLAYGEQGKYSLAEESALAPEKVPEQIKVRFVDVTEKAGMITKAVGSGPNDLASSLGPGACFLDYDGDGRSDLLLPDNGKEGGMSLYHNVGNGKFEEVTRKAGLDPTLHGIGCTAGDYDNDGATDLAVSFGGRLLLLHNEKNGTFKDVTEVAGLKSVGPGLSALFVDYDHDGDLDLYVSRANGAIPKTSGYSTIGPARGWNMLWRNNGNGTFTDVTEATGLSGGGASTVAVGTDYNNDRAIDLVDAQSVQPPLVFENPREGKFLARHFWPVAEPEITHGVAVLDFNHDGWMDFAFSGSPQPGITLWRNNAGHDFERVSLPRTDLVHAWGVAAIDYDNDGWVDLVAVGETAEGKGEVKLFRNLGPDGFKDVTADVGLDKIVLKEPRAIITGDYDNDGATDLLITQNHGPAVLLRNEGGNQNHWLRLNLTGLADNKSAIGTKVEVFAGGNRQKFEIAGSSGYLGQNSLQLTVGLGQAKQADVVRMLWPTGVLQDEVEVAADHEHKFMEIDRRGGSCPTLFVWDGSHYALVADMIGAGALGHWYRPGQRNISRPTEYIKIDRDSIREKDGKLSFRFMEPLEESVYLDQAQLLAVDHPGEFDVYPNEYFATDPPYPPFKIVFSRDTRPPVGAWDEHGHDLLPELFAHHYVGDFELLPFEGFTKLHSLELDLGKPYDGGPLWLLMHGEVEYYSATAMYAANQAGTPVIAPYVEALGGDGKWTRVADDFGFPAGGPRTITADLTGKLPRGAERIRIWTNAQVYWDNILIDRADQGQDSRATWVPLVRADLRFHGFPLKIEGKPPGNVQYIYEQASATGPYTHPAGNYTRYGDVLPLVRDFDDRLVVFGSGEEVALDFDPASLPSLPSGWTRDYFFLANGYEKDMDFYSYDWTHVDPLPFRDMGTYPYPGKSFPLDDEHLNYLLEYNTRYMSGREPRGYGFDYGAPR